MRNRRIHERSKINIQLEIESLFKQDDYRIDQVNEFIEVTDISKTGLGFIARHELPLDYYFNARICLDEEKRFYCVIKLIRKVEEEDGIHYGCLFVGLAEMLAEMIVEYQKEHPETI